MKKQISKAQMLAAIVESGEQPFTLTVVKATGKEEGELRTIRAYYGVPNPKRGGGGIGEAVARKKRKGFMESNSIPLTEFGSKRLLTPFISHIVEYNGQQVIH